jgi:hypothetical protein
MPSNIGYLLDMYHVSDVMRVASPQMSQYPKQFFRCLRPTVIVVPRGNEEKRAAIREALFSVD